MLLKKFSDKARALSENVDFRNTVEAAKEAASNQIQTATSKSTDIFETYWPMIEESVVSGLLTATTDGLADETTLQTALERAYIILPPPLRLVLSRPKFVAFGMQKRDFLLRKLNALKSE